MKRVVLAWALWGFALYLTAPTIPYFMDSLGNGALYLALSQAFGTALIPLAYFASKRVRPSVVASAFLFAYAVGLATMPTKSILSALLVSAYWGAVPAFYSAMRDEKGGWAISMVPGAVLPLLGSLDPTTTSIVAGVSAALAGIIALNSELDRVPQAARSDVRVNPLPALLIVAIAMAYPVSFTAFGLSELQAGVALSIGYAVGIALTALNDFRAFLTGLFAFSTISFAPVTGLASWALGLTEALLAYSVEDAEDIASSARLATFESLSYLWGFGVAFLLSGIAFLLPILAGGLAVFYALLLPVLALTVPVVVKLFRVLTVKRDMSLRGVELEGPVEPYFKVS